MALNNDITKYNVSQHNYPWLSEVYKQQKMLLT